MKCIAVALLLLRSLSPWAQVVPENPTPKVRAITAFVRLDRTNFLQQIEDTLLVLRRAESEFNSKGYDVQTVRITTQPLAELVSGLSEEQALAFLKSLDDLSVKKKFSANIGPAARHDSDNPSTMHLLQRVLRPYPTLTPALSLLMSAASTGIQFAGPLSWLSTSQKNSPRGQGNFNFAITAMLKPYTPFYPGSDQTARGRQFAFGFETADLVRDVFGKDKGSVESAISDITDCLDCAR